MMKDIPTTNRDDSMAEADDKYINDQKNIEAEVLDDAIKTNNMSVNVLISSVFYQLCRLRDSGRIRTDTDLQDLHITKKNDDDHFFIDLSHGDTQSDAVTEQIKALRLFGRFLSICGFQVHLDEEVAVKLQENMKNWLIDLAKSEKIIQNTVQANIQYLFKVGDSLENFIKDDNKFDDDDNISAHADDILSQFESKDSTAGEYLRPSNARYDPPAVYDTVCTAESNYTRQLTYNTSSAYSTLHKQPVTYVPVGTVNAHFSTGYMY
jgi:hypothetical protein